MNTKQTVESYFDRLKRKDDWRRFFSDRVTFTSFTSPVRKVTGRDMFLEATKRFYSTIGEVEVRDVLVDGDRACALTHYRLQRPDGVAIESDVAEIFEVKDGRIDSFSIYFDTAPFPK
ncbi:MAG TPA: nuclear transport factor 2 family protein [Candidatus Didemnitutus sp.]|nr:nuclear transport factor 2 family protein [Candidatus Didemnitutus sp.]